MLSKALVLVAITLVLGLTFVGGMWTATTSVQCGAEDVVLVDGVKCVHMDELTGAGVVEGGGVGEGS